MTPILYAKRDGIASIELNRPEKLNALNPEMICRLADAWKDAASDHDVRVVLLTAAGAKAFCAGADLDRLVTLRTGARTAEDEWDARLVADPALVGRATLRNASFFKPVVAAVNGLALGGGVEIIVNTDIRIAADLATFGLAEVTRGLAPAGGSLVALPRQVSWCIAMEIILLGEPIDARRAADIGFINRVVPASSLRQAAEDVAARLAVGAPLAQRCAKEAMLRGSGRPFEDATEFENAAAAAVLGSEDAREGARAFIEKRSPNFVGR